MGVFEVSEANRHIKTLELKAYDYMLRFEKSLKLTASGGTAYSFLLMASTECNVELAQTNAEIEAMPNGKETLGIYSDNDMESYRDLIFYVAQVLGCVCLMNREGKLELIPYGISPVAEVTSRHRYDSSYSDFVTRYTAVSSTNLITEESEYYALDPDDALTLNLGVNPLLQFGLKTTRYSGVSIFSNKIKCAECGSWYGSKVWHSNDKYRRVIYRCNHKFDGNRKCETSHVTEEIIAAFIKAMNTVITERDEIIANIQLIRQTVCGTADLEEEQDKLRSEMEIVVELTQGCVAENARTAQNQEDYQKRYDGLVERYEKVKSRYDAIVEAIEEKQAHYEKLGIFIETLEKHGEPIAEFDVGMWGSMVEYITVDKDKNMTVTFKDGSEVQA